MRSITECSRTPTRQTSESFFFLFYLDLVISLMFLPWLNKVYVCKYSYRNIRDHLWRWSTLTGSTEICRSIWTNPFIALLFSRFYLCREFGKWIKNGKSHSFWLARFDRKMSFPFSSESPLVSDWSVWYGGSAHGYRSETPTEQIPISFPESALTRRHGQNG